MAKKSLKVPQKSFDTKQDFHDFVENEREWMYGRIVKAISDSLERGDIRAHIFDASIMESMSKISMYSDIEEWETSLNLAIKWYQDEERYEECAMIMKLIHRVRTALD